ncbi:MAG: PAS domain S-box protein [Polyangiaceae bacterium]|nr:PAS domain S-box protein [Polyangiaceae bacterium]
MSSTSNRLSPVHSSLPGDADSRDAALRRAVSFARLGVLQCDAHGGVRWADGNAADLLELVEAPRNGTPEGAPVCLDLPFVLEMCGPADDAPWKLALENGQVRGALTRLRTAKDHVCTLLVHGYRLEPDVASRLGAVVELVVQPEPETLEQNPDAYAVVFEGVSDGIVVRDAQTDAVVDIDDQLAKILLLSAEASVQKPGQTSTLPADESNQEAARRIRLAAAGEPQLFEWPAVRADGQRVCLEVSCKRVRIGGLPRLLAVVRDITEQKAAEHRLRRSEERFRAVVNRTHDIVCMLDTSGRFTFISARGEETVGYAVREWQGKSFAPLVHPDDLDKAMDAFTRALGRESVNRQVRLIDAQGRTRQLMIAAEPLWEEGKVVGVLGLGRDTTEQSRLEDELHKAQRLESLGLLAGGIAHDFNNILTAIVGSVTLAKQMRTRPEVFLEALEMAEKACIRARDLTQQLLTFSRGGAPVRKPGLVGELLRETADFSLRGTNVRAELDLQPGLWWVEMDAGQMSQVIHNLLINAAQATLGGGTVRLRAYNCEIGPGDKHEHALAVGRYVGVAVTDHGHGIAPEHLTRVFDPYFSTKTEGSGLGLATSFSIVRRHGGHIEVSSTHGQGATFVLYLPATEAQPSQPEEIPVVPRVGAGRVLLMDDEEMVRQVGGKMLELLGYDVVRAREGGEAIRLYERAQALGAPFDAVVLDLTVPGGMGGKDTAARLRGLDSDARLIASSGYSSDPVMANHAAYGFDGVLAKPYLPDEIQKVLLRVSRHRAGTTIP